MCNLNYQQGAMVKALPYCGPNKLKKPADCGFFYNNPNYKLKSL